MVERFTAGLHVPMTEDENAFQEAKRKAAWPRSAIHVAKVT